MVMTLAESAAYQGYVGLEAGVIKKFTMVSPILDIMPFDHIPGDSITYRIEDSLPSVAWRGVNQTYSESTGTINPVTERTFILGGEVKMDNYIVKTQGQGQNGVNVKAEQFALKAQAIANNFDQAFFEGDDLTDANSMVGLKRRLTGTQVITQATNGTALTLAALDNALDLVPFPDKVIFCNRNIRRQITVLQRAAGQSVFVTYDRDNQGIQVQKYAEIPLYIVERTGDASTILDFDETCGTNTTTASLYVVSFGPDRVQGIYAGDEGLPVTVQDFGEIQASPVHLGRIEFYPGMAIKHGRAAARLRGITSV